MHVDPSFPEGPLALTLVIVPEVFHVIVAIVQYIIRSSSGERSIVSPLYVTGESVRE